LREGGRGSEAAGKFVERIKKLRRKQKQHLKKHRRK